MIDIGNIISAIAGALVGSGGILFFRQTRDSKIIENMSRLASEWEKLYREQKTEKREDSDKIEKLSIQVAHLTGEMEILKADKTNLTRYKCINIECEKRNPPIKND